MSRPIDQSIGRIAARQRGYVTRRQLLEAGLGARAITYRIAAGDLIQVHTGVYALGHAPQAFTDRAYAAVLACGPKAVLSHSSAASLWGILDRWWEPFEVIVDTARRRPGIRMHRAPLQRGDTRRHLGIRVTSPARTVFDIAPRLTPKALTRAVNELRIARRLKLEHLADLANRLPRHPGTSRITPFIESPQGPTRSPFEDMFPAFAKRFDLPPYELNAQAAGCEVDVLFPQQRVIVELDGYEFHSTPRAYENDRERDANALAAGFVTVRITWARMTHAAEREGRRLHGILKARS
jgi:hypothetical protein